MKKYTFIISIVIFIVILNIVAGIGFYYYNQYMKVNNLLQDPSTAVDKQTQETIAKVGKLIMLPKNEEPTVASITDVSKLKQQKFFDHATNGDKLLVYMKARRAILYNPKLNIIVDVGPVTTNPSQTQVQGATDSSLEPTPMQDTPILTPQVKPTLTPTSTATK